MTAVFLDGVNQLRDPIAAIRDDLADRRPPVAHVIVQIQHHVDLTDELIRAVKIGLVDGEHVADLKDARLDRLDVVAHARDQYNHCGVRRPHNIHLGLPDTDSLDKDDVLAECIHDLHCVSRFMREAAKAAARSHAADKNALVERQVVHADAVAQNGAAGKGACGVDGDDADGFPALAVFLGNLVRHGAFARTRRAGNAQYIGMSRMGIERLHNVRRRRAFILDRRDGTREREAVSIEHFGCNIHAPTSFAKSLHGIHGNG